MAFEASSRIQVANHYGPRDTGGTAGVERTTKSLNVFSVEITGRSLTEDWISNFVFPQNAKILRAFITVDEPFDAGVTAVSIGEGEDPTVNGITITDTELDAVGVEDITDELTGTWAVGSNTARASRVGIAVTGTPTDEGLATITIEYLYKTRDDTNWEPDPDTMPAYPAQT